MTAFSLAYSDYDEDDNDYLFIITAKMNTRMEIGMELLFARN